MPNGKIGGFFISREQLRSIAARLDDNVSFGESLLRPWQAGTRRDTPPSDVTAHEVREILASNPDCKTLAVEVHGITREKDGRQAASDYSYVLGLPGEPRVDKDVPWTSVPRS